MKWVAPKRLALGVLGTVFAVGLSTPASAALGQVCDGLEPDAQGACVCQLQSISSRALRQLRKSAEFGDILEYTLEYCPAVAGFLADANTGSLASPGGGNGGGGDGGKVPGGGGGVTGPDDDEGPEVDDGGEKETGDGGEKETEEGRKDKDGHKKKRERKHKSGGQSSDHTNES